MVKTEVDVPTVEEVESEIEFPIEESYEVTENVPTEIEVEKEIRVPVTEMVEVDVQVPVDV
jgi:hypothetical protein